MAGHRYLFIPGAMTWAEAKAKAEMLGGHLVTITGAEEQEFVIRLCDPFLRENFFMASLGAIRTGEGEGWSWVTGEPFGFAVWAPDNPSSSAVGDWLSLMRTSAKGGGHLAWNDFETTSFPGALLFYLRGFVVEWERDAPPAAAGN